MTSRLLLAAACGALLSIGCAAAPSTAAKSNDAPTLVNWSMTPAQIGATCKSRIQRANREIQALADSTSPETFSNTVLKLENISSDLGDDLVAQSFLAEVAPARAVREASLACQSALAAFSAETNANPRLYKRLVAAKASRTAAGDYDRALTDLWISQFEQAGAGLPSDRRADFVRLSKQLSDIQNRSNQNISDDATAIRLPRRSVAGLPPDFMAILKTASDGTYTVPVNDSTLPRFLGNAQSESARKQFYNTYYNIQVPANVRLLEQAIGIRDRLAHLLGFENWAAYQMHTRSESSPTKIVSFLQGLDDHILPAARRDIERLTDLKRKQTGNASATFEPWDVNYYLNELTKAQYAVDQNVVRQYFPAPHTVNAIFTLYQRLLGVKYTPITPANNWYPNVTEYAVSDAASGRFIGTFLLDLYPREGKPGGAFNAPIISVRRLAGGGYRPAISAMIVSTWPAPSKDKPALLTHDDVVVFLHEFGHCMAALLTTVPYESLSQFNGDFVEAPSQMLENFGWDRAILKEISSNVNTGEPMPDDLIDRLISTRCVTDRACSAYAASRQLLYSLVDLDYHMSGPHVDSTAEWADLAKKDTPMPLAPRVHPQAQFTHLMSGYDAGYYVYLWSLVYAQDMFTAFQEGGLESPDVGMRYRQMILAPARTYSPDVEVRNFLGRPMNPEAFYRGFNGR